jgi:hypothetical protein
VPWPSSHGPQSTQYLSDPGFVLQNPLDILPEELLLLVDEEEPYNEFIIISISVLPLLKVDDVDVELEELLTPPPKIVGST